MEKINRKIPGILPPPPKTEMDGRITNLLSKTIPELQQIRDRQQRLLNNALFVSKLPDKGEKIKFFCDKIDGILKSKQEADDLACLIRDNLKLNNLDKNTIQDVEWDGSYNKRDPFLLDSDDDSEPEDVMEILSQATAKARIVHVLKPEKPLITPNDLQNIGEIPHIKYLVNITEKQVMSKQTTGQYKPYRTTKTDVHDPQKEMARKKGKHWEVTAATPPLTVHGPVKILNLEESLKLQQAHNRHMKEIEIKHASEKLMALAGIKMAKTSGDISTFGSYREADSGTDTDNNEGSDKEVLDEEPDRGGVVFTVMK